MTVETPTAIEPIISPGHKNINLMLLHSDVSDEEISSPLKPKINEVED